MKKTFCTLTATGMLLFISGSVVAQQAAATAPAAGAAPMLSSEKIALIVLVVAAAAILLVLATLLRIIKLLSNELHKIYFAERGIDIESVEKQIAGTQKTGWQKLMDALTDAVPVEREKDVMLDHGYDGIKELDNSLPPWWVYMFYITIFFSVVYLLHYHILGTGKLSAAEYQAEMEDARIAKIAQEQALAAKGMGFDMAKLAPLTDAASLESGKNIFVTNCASCHGNKGEGGVGPNLTDKFWIHGGDFKSIFNVITNGVLDKGMIAWKAMLKPQKIQEVASYIETLQGTSPPNAKAPQGTEFKPEQTGAATGSANAPADGAKTTAPKDSTATQTGGANK
ncbi:cytochrome oxidase subunit III [Sphingobacteriales bacterium UPWRP_1]|nr:hypothetical protein BVG80_13460 [Sphingobacteriales bacterium TSM_CSM]PSJ74401.1 cytochrome oxidase subunit III [Sphingobacteriales bacterium UPWRP_1]